MTKNNNPKIGAVCGVARSQRDQRERGDAGFVKGMRQLWRPLNCKAHALLGRSKNQQGAMFGLDARIALAIFGVLSIVGGYTATNMFKEAQITQLSTELDNLKKAYQEYLLSTGEYTTRFMDLIKNDYDVVGWKGPYTDLLSDKSRIYEGVYSFAEGRQDVPGVPPVECSGGICAIWLKLTKVKDTVAADIDQRLDAEPSPNGGVLRIEYQQGGTDDIYYLVTAKH
ncbi:MAG: hypothetical protein WAX89_07810 [Alphaproteobacteria bacterium]